jgi:hypothetical protein
MKKTIPNSKPKWSIMHLTKPLYSRDFEFKPARLADVFSAEALPIGRCFGSKSGYRACHPGSEFIPNANIFCRTRGKIWWGDLDLAYDRPKIEAVARRLRMRLFVLSEHEGRFENATLPHSTVVSRAIWKTGGRNAPAVVPPKKLM